MRTPQPAHTVRHPAAVHATRSCRGAHPTHLLLRRPRTEQFVSGPSLRARGSSGGAKSEVQIADLPDFHCDVPLLDLRPHPFPCPHPTMNGRYPSHTK
ncbi:hypothetical protein B0H10DRAFT_534199 [Mycena sp. CBHHK59/15]|nr:hypothetical protein B0H10DRAFT_534199 [Mycena sp. CBHHK59/15]